MTRETKIGLLVGLAFIIVVGILLSEHLTTTTERPAAPLADAGEGVREGVAAPGVTMRDEPAPYRAPVPVNPVPIARDLVQQPQLPPAQVAVGPGAPVQPPIVITSNQTAAPIIPAIENGVQTPVTPVGNDPLITRTPTDIFANQHPIQGIAAQQGQAIVPVNTNGNTNNAAPLAANKVREYTAQPGDTLSRIASLLNGGNTKSNRDAVMALNPELKKDPNKVIAGRKYQLPVDAGAVAPVPAPAPVVQSPSPVVRTADRPAESTQYRTYVVKKGDNLTKIAIEQLGSKSHLPAIRELNQDVLKGSDVIKIDMKLKLPAKTVAASE